MSARLYAVVPAAGRGTRMGASLPKQYLSVEGRTVAEHTLSRLLSFARFARVVVAIAPDDPWFAQLPVAADPRLLAGTGGDTRADSVENALAALAGEAADDDFVLVHDVARPCVRLSDIARLVEAVAAHPAGGLLAHRATDTVKQAGGEQADPETAVPAPAVDATLDRNGIWLAATPQMFRYRLLREALAAAREDGVAVTDEAQAVERQGHRPLLVECARDNIKVTLPEDLALAAFWLRRQQEAAP